MGLAGRVWSGAHDRCVGIDVGRGSNSRPPAPWGTSPPQTPRLITRETVAGSPDRVKIWGRCGVHRSRSTWTTASSTLLATLPVRVLAMLATVRSTLPRTLRAGAPVARLHSAAAASLVKSSPLRPSSLRQPSLPRTTSVVARSMSSHPHSAESAVRPEPDKVLQDIADYVHNFKIDSELAFETARLCLIDTIGCGLEGLRFDACARLMGPVVEGTVVPNGKPAESASGPMLNSVQAPRSLEQTTRSTPSAAPSTSAPRYGGWTLTTAGSRPSGVTRRITLVPSWPSQITLRVRASR